MTIELEQMESLRAGDVVELRDDRWPDVTITGPLSDDGINLILGPVVVRYDSVPRRDLHRTVTVITPAPKPLYVNHPRTDPVQGDVARGVNMLGPIWFRQAGAWVSDDGKKAGAGNLLPDELILLVDADTGMPVTS